jgi:hypothetical protein
MAVNIRGVFLGIHPAGTSNLIQLTILRARTIALIAVLLSGAPAPFP